MSELKSRLENLAGAVELNDNEIMELFIAESKCLPEQITISIDHARTTSVQYNTNRYSMQLTIDLKPMNMAFYNILSAVDKSNEAAILKKSRQLGKCYMSIILNKIEKAGAVIRDNIDKEESKDGISPITGDNRD